MALKLAHQLKQKLYLGQKLQQSLELLTMDNLKLESFMDECLLSNPCLERCEEKIEHDEDFHLSQAVNDWPTDAGVASGAAYNAVEAQLESYCSLHDSLKQQVNCMQILPRQRLIAHRLISSLENDGYLADSVDVIANQHAWGITEVEQTLVHIIQKLEPTGVGARDLHEFLLLQLDESPVDQMVKVFLHKYVDFMMLEDQDLAQKSGYCLSDIKQLRQRLRRLSSSPAGNLHASDTVYVKPELIFHVREHDEIEVEVVDTVGKSVMLNQHWQQYSWQGSEKKFMRNAWNEARFLLNSLEQRRETMLKLGVFLADYQKLFIQYGVVSLRPLIMAKVAQALDLHESTISRVVNSKYAQTPMGLVHLKCFFSNGLSTKNGQDISIHNVKQRIQNLISAEKNVKPISDQKITQQLKSEGIEIARRTVAKYRESLGIPTSTKRKQKVS